MPFRQSLSIVLIALFATGPGLAQNKVKTETIRPKDQQSQKFKADGRAVQSDGSPEIVADLRRLPPAVARTRDRILTAARSGDLEQLLKVMQAGESMPVFSFSEDKDPIGFWKLNYPDSDGVEVLAILINILETAFVHVDVGTAQEIYMWPYFARVPLKSLKPEQKVELFRIVTGADYKDMVEFGAYSFYRVGISPDGTWHFFVSGD
jgi:hypothetical protein